MAIMDSLPIHQQPDVFYIPDQPAYLDFSQLVITQQPAVNKPPTFAECFVGMALFAIGGYALYNFCEPEPQRRRCSACGSKSHNIARCPHIGERQDFSWDFEKTGWCECCGYRFPKTELHHYAGRADNSKAKEMCRPCHLHCGHSGHSRNFAINPRYCRLSA